MGTPEFAVASLDALVKAGCTIVGVITAPDKNAGRGMQLQQSAVKKYAVEHQLKILQPEKLKSISFLEGLKSLKADLQIDGAHWWHFPYNFRQHTKSHDYLQISFQ